MGSNLRLSGPDVDTESLLATLSTTLVNDNFFLTAFLEGARQSHKTETRH